jgi:hypothetical protein
MKETVPLIPIRDRIRDLNTKGYYLLVALLTLFYLLNPRLCFAQGKGEKTLVKGGPGH